MINVKDDESIKTDQEKFETLLKHFHDGVSIDSEIYHTDDINDNIPLGENIVLIRPRNKKKDKKNEQSS